MEDDFGTSPDFNAAGIRENSKLVRRLKEPRLLQARVASSVGNGLSEGGGLGDAVFMGRNGAPVSPWPEIQLQEGPPPTLKGERPRESEGLDRGHGGIRMKLRVPPGQVAKPACKCDIAISVIDECHCPDLPVWWDLEGETKKAYDKQVQNLPAWQKAVCQALEKRINFLTKNYAGSIEVVQPRGISDEELADGQGNRRLGANRTIRIIDGKLVETGHQYFVAVLISYDCECECNAAADANPPCYAQFKINEESKDIVIWEPDPVKGGYGPQLSDRYEALDVFDRKRCYRAFVDSIGVFRDPSTKTKYGVPEKRLKGIATVTRKNPACKETAELEWVVKSTIDADGEPAGSLTKVGKASVLVEPK